MSLIPQKTLDIAGWLKGKPSMEVLDSKGNYVATIIIPNMVGGSTIYDEMKTQAEYLAVRANSVLPPEIVSGEIAEIHENKCSCGFEAKSYLGLLSHQRYCKVAV